MEISFEKGTPILQKEYAIAPHMYDSAFKDFQRKFVFPKNYIMSAVFIIIAIIDIVLVITGKSPALLIVALICIGVLVAMWINTNNVRKRFVQSMAKFKDERQTAQFFDDGIIIKKIPKGSTEGEKIAIDFSKDTVKLLDKRYYFIAYVNNSNFNIIPKKVFDATEENTLSNCFQKKLGSNYIK